MSQVSNRGRVVVTFVLAVMFGLSAALFKGQANGLRYAVGNLSGPWLLVAFWCGCRGRSRRAGAAFGVAATLLALAGFCLGLALISDYGTTSALAKVHLAFRANTRYFEAGLISGPLLGALGATCTRHAANRILFAGVVLLAEPIATVTVHRLHLLSGTAGMWSAVRLTACVIEGVCGAVLILAALIRQQRSAPHRGQTRGL